MRSKQHAGSRRQLVITGTPTLHEHHAQYLKKFVPGQCRFEQLKPHGTEEESASASAKRRRLGKTAPKTELSTGAQRLSGFWILKEVLVCSVKKVQVTD